MKLHGHKRPTTIYIKLPTLPSPFQPSPLPAVAHPPAHIRLPSSAPLTCGEGCCSDARPSRSSSKRTIPGPPRSTSKHNAAPKHQGCPVSNPESFAPDIPSPRDFSLGKHPNAHSNRSGSKHEPRPRRGRGLLHVFSLDRNESHRRRTAEGPWKQGRTEAGVRKLRL